MKLGTKRTFVIVLLIACTSVFAISAQVRYVTKALAFTAIYGFSMTADRRDADVIKEVVLESHKFPRNSILSPSQPPVFCSAGSHFFLTRPAECSIYGVVDKAEQKKIAGSVQGIVEQRIRRPVIVNFLAEENLRLVPESNGAYSRGAEHLLIAFRIDSAGKLRVIRENEIQTYHPST